MPYSMRKIRGKDLYKVFNTQSGELTSKGSSKADAKSQLRLLRGLEKKEGGSLKADQIKDVLDYSYNNKTDKAPDGYVIDKDLSDGRVKVYKDLNSNQVIVAHRGSSGWKDWLDNAYYATTGNIKDSGTYKTHKKKHEKALSKYGADNVISVGHSRAGKYVEELNKETPVKEVLTYNKAVGIHDAFQKNPSNQTDIRSSRDLISGLSPFQRSKNKVVTIASNTFNPLKAHGTSALSSLGNKLIGKGFKQMRVGDMRKFVKHFKRAKYGENFTGGAKYNKKQLIEMVKPILEDDDIDELVGGSVWTDFVKEFSAKHNLKYACSLSKYKEPLKKAYKLKKENKDWYEPFKIDAISETDPEPKPNITFTIEEPEPVPTPVAKPQGLSTKAKRQNQLLKLSVKKLKELLEVWNVKGMYKMNKDELIMALLKVEYPDVSGSGVLSGGNKWTDFVKDYAGKYNTTYGCALSDMNIKGAYKLFKEGKTWYFPKTAEMEVQTDDIIEPEPTPAPANIEPVINRVEEKIKMLEELGSKKGATSYNPSTIITDIAFVNLMKKFGGRCIVNNIMKDTGIELGIDVNSNPNDSVWRNNKYVDRLGKTLKECIDRGVSLICIPLSLKFNSSHSGHANMLIYRPFKRLVERYEPHGQQYGNSMVDNKSFNDQLKTLFEVFLKPYLGDIRYRSPDEFCPNPRGFQSLEGQLKQLQMEGGGFCSMWSFFVAELSFLNPDKSTKEILEEVYNTSKSDPEYLRSVIRGYVVEVEKGLDELLKTLGKSGFSFGGKGLQSPSLKFRENSTRSSLETWLLSVVFDSKKYSEAPPQFEPLPDVPVKGKSDKEKLKETYFDKMRGVKVAELENIFSIYGLKPYKAKRDDMLNRLIDLLINGDLKKYGSKDITDLDVILTEELHKKKGAFKSGLARTGYFTSK
jgi:hypothetical protein